MSNSTIIISIISAFAATLAVAAAIIWVTSQPTVIYTNIGWLATPDASVVCLETDALAVITTTSPHHWLDRPDGLQQLRRMRDGEFADCRTYSFNWLIERRVSQLLDTGYAVQYRRVDAYKTRYPDNWKLSPFLLPLI